MVSQVELAGARRAVSSDATALERLLERDVDLALHRVGRVLDALLAEVGQVELAVEDRVDLAGLAGRDVDAGPLETGHVALEILPGQQVRLHPVALGERAAGREGAAAGQDQLLPVV